MEFSPVAEYLFSLKPRGAKFGIDRMRVLSERLGHPEKVTRCVHVAGTNGKGSVSAMLDSILRTAGWRVGLFTSPHLVRVGERVQVQRRRLTDDELVRYVEELRLVSEAIERDAADLRPSFFELMTAMAFLQFARKGCDIAVYEVGLGGRLDATNVVVPEVTVITSIGLDHCEYLGTTIPEIASEKAGIIKPGVPVVIGRMPREAEKVIRVTAVQIGAPAVSVIERFGEDASMLPETNLEGEYQQWNAATATLAAEMLPPQWRITPSIVKRGLGEVVWPGRWQRLVIDEREVILDASHNAEGAATLARNLARVVERTGRQPIVVTGVLGASRAQPLLAAVCEYASTLHLLVPDQPRACSFAELRTFIPSTYKGNVVDDSIGRLFPDLGTCRAGAPGDIVVVTGSIYLIGEVMARLLPDEQSR